MCTVCLLLNSQFHAQRYKLIGNKDFITQGMGQLVSRFQLSVSKLAEVQSVQIQYRVFSMVNTQDIAEAVKQNAINDPNDAHLETLTFNCTNDKEMIDAVLSGTDGTEFNTI